MDLQKISQALDSYIRPATPPVAIKMVSSTDEIPEKAKMPKRDLRTPMPVCQGVALARRYGWLMVMGEEDMLCPLGALTLGFLPAKAKFLDGSSGSPFWLKDQDTRAKWAQALPRLEVGKYTHLLAAPINRVNFEPHVIIVYGNPAQISRLIQAYVCKTGESLTSTSFGGIVCGEEITRTMLTDQCQFIMGGGGDRVFAHAQDHEAAFAMPMSKVETITEGLEETHQAGLRYPTNPFLTYQAEFPPAYGELMDYLRQEG